MSDLGLSAWPFLLLLLLLPAGTWLSRRRRRRLPVAALGVSPIPFASRFWATSPLMLRSAALGLVVVALAGPIRSVRTVEERSEGTTILVAFDVSSSMLAEDFRPENRLAVAREEVRRFVEGRVADRIGLVAFAGEALTVVPGTLDHELLLQAVESLDVGQLEDGTAIGTALATAVNRLRSVEEGARVVVLLTDGDNNRGTIDPLDAAAAAEALGVRVYTIGVGRDGVAPVPIGRTRFGYQYANMPVQVNDELLDAVAKRTGGLYFRATDPEALAGIYDRIDALETAPILEERSVERASVRHEFVILALVFLLLELIGSALRGRRSLGP
ncbi:MAG: VWA domain-containing protein [marine benthic group bacterium]|nr:VWA domain-containing protein [Gemmatimonadota bacterium]MCL7956868.1 VWA domain-containing protein [Gemmatimonadota bacterium]